MMTTIDTSTSRLLATSAALLFSLSLGACYNPKLSPGAQHCASDGECPDGLKCFPDGHCWNPSAPPTCTPACGAAAPVCDTTTLTCLGCLKDSDCPTDSVCLLAAHVCKVGCSSTRTACAADAGTCDVDLGACRGCLNDSDCSNPASPRCEPTNGNCWPCLTSNDTCASGTYCVGDAATGFHCAAGCRTRADCTGGSDASVDSDGGAAADVMDCCAHVCVDTSTSQGNCGACGNACTGATGACCASVCSNLNADGQNCGACGTLCAAANATPICNAASCDYTTCATGFADCDGVRANGCETTTISNINNCGGCGVVCPQLPNATPACVASKCLIVGCATGFADCDAMAADGCEVNTQTDASNCGACGQSCGTPSNGTAACISGACSISSCAPSFRDCDGQFANGCEVDSDTDVANCGSCGNACPTLPNSAPTCVNGACGSTCLTGFADCDGNAANGCESASATDAKNCGKCGTACPVANNTPACVNSACTVGTCAKNFFDCDGNAKNGCEESSTALLTDPKNCGKCGTTCTMGCETGVCVNCTAPTADCDGNGVNGCESNIQFDAQNCGACGNPCPTGQTCTSGTCAVDTPVHAAGTFGPMHTFAGLTTDHYITQGGCSIGGANPNLDDAWYFCTHFYGPNCTVQAGYVTQTAPNLTYGKMHKDGGCTTNGSDIPNTVCSLNGNDSSCKIGNWSEITSGLANLVCVCK